MSSEICKFIRMLGASLQKSRASLLCADSEITSCQSNRKTSAEYYYIICDIDYISGNLEISSKYIFLHYHCAKQRLPVTHKNIVFFPPPSPRLYLYTQGTKYKDQRSIMIFRLLLPLLFSYKSSGIP